MGRPVNAVTKTMSTVEREALIVERRAQNVSFRAIGEELGISAPRVHQIFNEACARIPAAAMHTLRVESAERADRAIRSLLKIAEDERVYPDSGKPIISPHARIEAWNSIRGYDESLRRLFGADAPVRKEILVLTDDVIDAAIRKLNEEQAALDAQVEELTKVEQVAIEA